MNVHRAQDRLNMMQAFVITRVKDPSRLIDSAQRETRG